MRNLNTENLWENFLKIISETTNPVSFSAWFSNLKLVNVTNNSITIQVPMIIHKKMLGENYYSLIENTFFSLTGINYNIDFILENEPGLEKNQAPTEQIIRNDELDFDSNLITQYSFDNFIVGDTNRFAKTAALAVAEKPGKIYNPLFIYGKSGLGKTHLMHAIGNYINNNTDLKVLYTTSDDFRNDFIGITNANNGDNAFEYSSNFKNKYRCVDVLIIDDIQYLVGAEKTQQEFFHTFNELQRNNKQIIISSDRSPDDLKLLEERLRSRFAWGLAVDIYPPDFELRCPIIKNKIDHTSIANRIENDAIEYIANNCENDVRGIEGAINRLVAYTAMIVPEVINLEFVNEALKDYVNKTMFITNDIINIQKVVAEYYKLTVEILKSKKRSNNISYPRQIALYLSRMLTDESFPRIGLEFGGRDHSTVIHACDKIEADLKENNKLKEIINEIKNKL